MWMYGGIKGAFKFTVLIFSQVSSQKCGEVIGNNVLTQTNHSKLIRMDNNHDHNQETCLILPGVESIQI